MTLINELRNSGNLPVFHDGRKCSLLDQSGHGLNLTIGAGSGNKFNKTQRGYGYAGTVATEYTAGVQASLDLTTATIFVAYVSYIAHTSNINLVSKSTGLAGSLLNGYTLYMSAGVGIALGDNAATQTHPATYVEPIGIPTFVAFTWNGSNVISYLNGNLAYIATQTRIPTSTGQTYRFGWANAAGLRDVSLLFAGMSNRVLNNSEVARMYDEWLQDSYVLDLPRRNFAFIPQQGFNDATEISKSIVLDTDFQFIMDGATRKVRDLGPNNYIGAITGVVTPGQNGEGLAINVAASDEINNGDITQLNSTSSFTYETWFETLPGNIPASYIALKYKDSNNNIRIGCLGGSANPKQLVFSVFNAGAGYSNTTATQIRGGTKQHITCVFNGSGSTNADKSQIYIDGESTALTFATDFPATSSNLAGFGFYHALGAGQLGTRFGERIFSTALTATQVRQEYLNNFARKLLLRETLEDVPVTVGAAVGAGGYVGSSRIISGTAKVSETTDGRRWIECATSVVTAMPQPTAFGTWRMKVRRASPLAGNLLVMFVGSVPTIYSDAAMNGYGWYLDNNGYFGVTRIAAGASAAWEHLSTAGYYAGNTEYDIVTNRRPSDGRFTSWLRGGAFADWTLANSDTAGSNPSAADATFVASTWTTSTFFAGNKFCGFDTNDSRIAVMQVYQGVLNPWELP